MSKGTDDALHYHNKRKLPLLLHTDVISLKKAVQHKNARWNIIT